MKPKPFSALNHFTVPSAMCWFPDCAVSLTFGSALAGPAGSAHPESTTVAGPTRPSSRGAVVPKLDHIAVGITHVKADSLAARAEKFRRSTHHVEGAGVGDRLEITRLDDETHVVHVARRGVARSGVA